MLMRAAIEVAEATRPHPNPRVGAVVVDPEGRVTARRAHERPGEPHAEVLALAEAGPTARGGTLVVTLEPCDHHGRTPPCTEAILAAGVERVVVGALDPDPRVAGAGVARLRAAGVDVVVGVDDVDAEELDPAYFHQRRTGRPLVTSKLALTLDGQAAAADGTSRWITGPEARRDVHRLRAAHDAVVVGAGTLREDDPRLDVRLETFTGPQPLAVVVAGDRPLPSEARLWARDEVLVVGVDKHDEVPDHVEQVLVPGRDRPEPQAVVDVLADRGVLGILLEGGPTLAGAFLRAGVVDRVVVYLAPSLGMGTGIPGIAGAFETLGDRMEGRFRRIVRVGDDVRIELEPAR
ncbi:MAG TPA: bifunctional diaminohydroxyphosphoribosylaminopyrimidine deaminase/5-amino-6-(5-phosphoribosylamino)uracil reductase RibD [Actinobacteria bacterium]|nr:bifunctional diaminohydroxyphosphoribosylaminopyrimidine deaminase/5-amino-6-(5-phosphoribosylamino)uracil reductase RibD [Actinomycetota bacterium]